jgi:hypothetical protein
MAKADTFGARPRGTLILSPLLNLPPGRPGGPQLVQHVPLRPIPGGDCVAVARLSLSPDRLEMTVTVDDRDGNGSYEVRLHRLGRIAGRSGRAADSELRVLELARRRGGACAVPLRRQVDLSDASGCPQLSAAKHRPLAPRLIAAIRPDAIVGLPGLPEMRMTRTPAYRQRPPAPDRTSLPYLHRRLLDELTAALAARCAAATCRHVELATMYARRIQGA